MWSNLFIIHPIPALLRFESLVGNRIYRAWYFFVRVSLPKSLSSPESETKSCRIIQSIPSPIAPPPLLPAWFPVFIFSLLAGKQGAYGILKRKLDPFNVVLLRSYLKIAPFLGGAYYLAVFFVQQKFRGFFPYAYFGAVAVFVAPAAIIVLTN